jgi:fatty acid desaturase
MAQAGRFFAHSNLDAIPVALELLHLAFVAALFFAFPRLSSAGFVALALIYALSIDWSINSTSHNFIHNPFFTSTALNRLFAFVFSLSNGFTQTLYHHMHLRHHVGNMDRPDAQGRTIDPLSIYQYGRDGAPEPPLRYMLLSYFRDDIADSYRRVKARRPGDAAWIRRELALVIATYGACLAYDWRAFLALTPFYYFGHSLSSLNGYYEHYRGNPDRPIAWGVSTYDRFYNLTWLNNGYHAEHHYRPKVHWTRMHELHLSIRDKQRAAGVHVIRWPHFLGFLQRPGPGLRP